MEFQSLETIFHENFENFEKMKILEIVHADLSSKTGSLQYLMRII